MRGDAEVEQHAVDVGEPEVGEHLGDLVVHRVDEGDALAVAARAARRLRSSACGSRSMPITRASGQRVEDRLGVAAEAEGRVDEDRARAARAPAPPARRPGRAAPGRGRGSVIVGCLAGEREDEQQERRASAVEAAAEKTMTASASRTSWRTRRRRGWPALRGWTVPRLIGLDPCGALWSLCVSCVRGSPDQVPARSLPGKWPSGTGEGVPDGRRSGRETSSYETGCSVVLSGLLVCWSGRSPGNTSSDSSANASSCASE